MNFGMGPGMVPQNLNMLQMQQQQQQQMMMASIGFQNQQMNMAMGQVPPGAMQAVGPPQAAPLPPTGAGMISQQQPYMTAFGVGQNQIAVNAAPALTSPVNAVPPANQPPPPVSRENCDCLS